MITEIQMKIFYKMTCPFCMSRNCIKILASYQMFCQYCSSIIPIDELIIEPEYPRHIGASYLFISRRLHKNEL